MQKLVAKANIQASSLSADLLTMLESGAWSNDVKTGGFSFEPATYCCTLIWCTTDKNFHRLWSQLTGGDDGLDSRTFFLINPEQLKPVTAFVDVDTYAGARNTQALLEKAIIKGTYPLANLELWHEAHARLDNRTVQMAEKFALALAVDLDRDSVDEECQRRGLALAEYRDAVYRWLRPFEADNKLAQLQQLITNALERAPGRCMKVRELERKLNYQRFGTQLWGDALNGLMRMAKIGVDSVGTRPRMIWLVGEGDQD